MEITMAAKTVKFGIMATGDIARQITETIQSVPGAEVWAVGSRTLEKVSLKLCDDYYLFYVFANLGAVL